MRGKTVSGGRMRPVETDASMRPPQNAGENKHTGCLPPSWMLASMRPPQNAGENEEAHR